jgi:hypothetical protein
MTTDKQALANRRNAGKSTGPVTVSGKAVSAQNALKHGVLAQAQVLVSMGEDAKTLEGLRERLLEDLQPEGELEELLADRVVALVWRLRRLHLAEVGLFDEAAKRYADPLARVLEEAQGGPARKNYAAAAAGWTFQLELTEGALNSLSRYEAGIERGLFKALHELQRLQAYRAGVGGPLPIALDVEVGSLA